MTETIRSVFLDQYRRSGLDPINSIWDEHFFQILNKEGGIVVSSRNAVTFLPDLDGELLRGAYEGKERFGFQEVGGETIWSPISDRREIRREGSPVLN